MSLKTYSFEVREVTVRDAWIAAPSLKEARRLLREWIDSEGTDDAEQGGQIMLGDLQTVGLSARYNKEISE